MAGGRGSGARAELAGRTPGEGGEAERGGVSCYRDQTVSRSRTQGVGYTAANTGDTARHGDQCGTSREEGRPGRPQPDPGPTARGNQRRWKEDAIRAGRTDQDEPDVCVSFAAASAVIAGRD
uniref:Uncharacterized protein n=1 Tax=Knipowitschia caucasica TaxID=637954 RepID=A0AAV2L1F7_KNICA